MKRLFLIFCFSLSISSQAADFALGEAYTSALEDAQVELDHDSIQAFSAKFTGPEISVNIRGLLNGQEKILKYGCDRHGSQIVCHNEGEDHLVSSLIPSAFQNFLAIHNVAVKKFEATLLQRNQNLSSVVQLKTWQTEGTEDHAITSMDVWTRFDFKQNNSVRTVYVQCHDHGAGEIACHYKQTAVNEPAL